MFERGRLAIRQGSAERRRSLLISNGLEPRSHVVDQPLDRAKPFNGEARVTLLAFLCRSNDADWNKLPIQIELGRLWVAE